jgi:hypothetical protein
LEYWKIIADRLSKKGWNWAIAGTPVNDQTVYVVDALSPDGRQFIVRSDQLLTAFLEIERASNAKVNSR